MEKADLNVTVTEINEWQYLLEQSFSAFTAAADTESKKICLEQIGVYGCMALKYASEHYAELCFQQLLQTWQDDADAVMRLKFVRLMLVTAARLRKKHLFSSWLLQAEAFLTAIIVNRQKPDEVSDFLLGAAFCVCDRKNKEAFTVTARLMMLFVRTAVNKAVQRRFLSEWAILAAQMNRRKWFDVSDFLLTALLQAVWRKRDEKLLNMTLLQLQLHLQMYYRWDGLENALYAYRKLQYFYLLLIDYAGRERYCCERRRIYLRAVLLNMRDLIANLARASMQDELQIIRQWHDCLVSEADARMQRRIRLFMQLEISYWQRTKPKTSRKQMAYLSDLLQPELLSGLHKELLREIS